MCALISVAIGHEPEGVTVLLDVWERDLSNTLLSIYNKNL
jgi:hypothetical protein